MIDLIVIGAGLAGSEAAWATAQAGRRVRLYEMRPVRMTPAHSTDQCAELVCSNSFRSNDPLNTIGCLKEEMRTLGSLTLEAAAASQVPAGKGLAMDRQQFAQEVTQRLERHPLIELCRQEVRSLADIGSQWEASDTATPVVIATGPLTADTLAREIQTQTGTEDLYFYDSMAPLVATDSLDESQMYRASRYGYGEGDEFLNMPLDRAAYETFCLAIIAADKVEPRAFEDPKYFEGCLPIEVMAERGLETLRHGPMKPMGLPDPRTGRPPHAVIQLRRDNREGTIYNIVGFQTRMTWTAQRAIFQTLPGLANADFVRMGAMHRNTYINSPRLLDQELRLKRAPHIRVVGQMIGVEGYVESAAMGQMAGMYISDIIHNNPPPTTALGSLMRHVTEGNPARFEPMNANWGLTPQLMGKVRYRADFEQWRAQSALADNKSVAIAEAF
jgi:methylenetetrahydrofolate--tRNA-(uracil-5-)-methyltransferase